MSLFLFLLSVIIWAGIFCFYWRGQIYDWLDCNTELFERKRRREARKAAAAEEAEKAKQNQS